MNVRRGLLGGFGLGTVGLVLVAGRELGSVLPVDAVVSALGNDYFLAVALGAVTLLVALVVLERGGDVDQSEMPDPEGAVSAPTPGDGLSADLGRWRLALPLVGRSARRAVRERLRETAVETIRRTERCTEREARERLKTGAWTDDVCAASLLSGSGRHAPWTHVRAARRGESAFAHRARRTAAEIASLADSTERSGGSP